jgi:hypothetical protein
MDLFSLLSQFVATYLTHNSKQTNSVACIEKYTTSFYISLSIHQAPYLMAFTTEGTEDNEMLVLYQTNFFHEAYLKKHKFHVT